MTVDMEKYESLLQQIGGISKDHISREALEKLKEKYRNDIHSKRVLEDIVDINCLLKVLKKRGVLQYNDLTVLRSIIDEYVQKESIKQQIRDIIVDYDQWLNENSGSINFLYSSGKSNVLLTSHELNIRKVPLKVSDATYLNDNFDENLQPSTEEMSKESLLTNELNNLNIPQNEKDTDSFYVIKFKKCPLNISKKKGTTVLIFLILIFILIGIIWILIKLPESPAVVPGHPPIQAASGQPQLHMPFYMPNVNAASYSTQSTFFVNQTQTFTTSTGPPVDKEKELQKLVINELSRKIGKDWKDVCRSLDIAENTIDEITMEHSKEPFGNKYERMFKDGLKLYFSKPRPNWRNDIIRALRSARRVDLQQEAEQIIHDPSNL